MPRKELVGVVVSDKMDKTCVVAVEESKRHPRYHKIYIRTERFAAHDADNKAKVGDTVSIIESRPMSKTKRFALKAVLKHQDEI